MKAKKMLADTAKAEARAYLKTLSDRELLQVARESSDDLLAAVDRVRLIANFINDLEKRKP